MTEDDSPDGELDELLLSLDHDRRIITAEDVIARAEGDGFRWSRVVAGIALILALAGAAYALPGSPVRSWLGAILERPGPAQPAAFAARDSQPEAERSGGGVVFDPAEPLVVAVRLSATGHLRIALTDDTVMVAEMVSGEAHFSSEPKRLVVDILKPGSFELRIPRAAGRVEVFAGAKRIFLKQHADISATVQPDAAGRYLFLLRPEGQ